MRLPERAMCKLSAALLSLAFVATAHADNFISVSYDAKTDELAVTLVYRGTNPNHTFRIDWGTCVDIGADAPPELAAQVLDRQWNDKAEREFTKTVRFGLKQIPCRPVNLTLRTAPRFYASIFIPARRALGSTGR